MSYMYNYNRYYYFYVLVTLRQFDNEVNNNDMKHSYRLECQCICEHLCLYSAVMLKSR